MDLWTFRRIADRTNFLPGAYDSDIVLVNWPQIDYLPGTIVWSRDSAGEYRGTLANAFDVNTYVEIINLESSSVSIMKGGVSNPSNIYITQRNTSGTLTDSTGGFIIKIYKLIPLT